MIDRGLENARKIAGLSQQDLAEKTGIKRSKIAMIETGERELSTSELKKVASALGIAPCFILSEEPEKTFNCGIGNLGLNPRTVEAIRNMSDEVRVAFEYLINDPTFGLEIAAYFFPSEDEGIHLNGNPIAKAEDEIALGSHNQYPASWKVDDLYEYVMERELASTLLNIRRRIKR